MLVMLLRSWLKKMRLRPGVSITGLVLLCVSGVAHVRADAPAINRNVSVAEYRIQIESMKTLVQDCLPNAAACDVARVSVDEQIPGGFNVRWGWLREAVKSAHDEKLQGREKLLQEADARLDEDVALASGADKASNGGDEFERARVGADRILKQSEFRTVTEQSYIEREIAAFYTWLDRVFSGMSQFGKRSPWLVPLAEWGSITLAAAGLLVWVLRMMRRQRLAVALEMGAKAEVWQKESDDWAELARAEAARQEWRSAVHCMYWATIVMMEGRKLWRQNRARTPREYVMLLEPGSRMQQTLRRLTQVFERIWYGLRPAEESDYEQARLLFEELRTA